MKKGSIDFPDFAKFDLRVGEVKEASLLEGSKKLIILKVDLGEDYGVVEILSGLSPTYQPADLVGNKYIVLANLAPKQMMGSKSNGMILVADDPEKFALLPLDKNLKNGTVIR
ncbi:methionine--tRNA ligase [Candidatus Roizmanbacteria bacterium CG_4_9_14_3_um_filter_33_18]|uniref:Methionine--tRNA ligase n=1 Tax=Candidatus Roizmanbacteria bacterium CG_4_9_14_3_um_filter_33_18 TaxID=1974841 RepID=A0A2M7XWL0_9BACT|nr:MAG: methionine--tRNA ligase [Candidatus Roizmanbacteria bacterium CG_4_9_14_3_um_filter_33_18]